MLLKNHALTEGVEEENDKKRTTRKETKRRERMYVNRGEWKNPLF